MENIKVLITVEGGMVSNVISNVDMDILICDYDTDGLDDDILTFNPYCELAFMYTRKPVIGEEEIQEFLNCFWDNRRKEE